MEDRQDAMSQYREVAPTDRAGDSMRIANTDVTPIFSACVIARPVISAMWNESRLKYHLRSIATGFAGC